MSIQSGLACPVLRLENLLLATDGSQYSEGAIREAIGIAKRCSSKLYAHSVVEAVTDYEVFPLTVEDALLAAAKEHLQSVLKRATDEGVDCETIITNSGEPHKSIVEEAGKRHADMIIIGRRGRTGLKKFLMGEVAAHVIGHASCRVLVVPRAAHVGFEKILVAVDGSRHGEAALREAVSIAKRCGSAFVVLSSMQSEEERKEAQSYVDGAMEFARKEGIGAEGVTPLGKSYDTIVETAGGRGVDLIVMGTYGKTGLKRALMGSSTEKVIGQAGCAVMVVKAA